MKVTKEHNAECQKLLKLMGIPCIIVSDRFIPSCRKNLLVRYVHNRHRQKLAQRAELARGGKVRQDETLQAVIYFPTYQRS